MNNKKLLAMALMVMGSANAMKRQYKQYKDAMFARFDAENNQTSGMTKAKVTPVAHTKEEKWSAYHAPKSSDRRTAKEALFARFDAENKTSGMTKAKVTPVAHTKEEKWSAYHAPKSSDRRTAKEALFARFDAENKTSGMTKEREEEEKSLALSVDESDVDKPRSLKKPVNLDPLYSKGYTAGREAMQKQLEILQALRMNAEKDLQAQAEEYKKMQNQLKNLQKQLDSAQKAAKKINDSNALLQKKLISGNELYEDDRKKLDDLRKDVENLNSYDEVKTLKDKVAGQIEKRSQTDKRMKKVGDNAFSKQQTMGEVYDDTEYRTEAVVLEPGIGIDNLEQNLISTKSHKKRGPVSHKDYNSEDEQFNQDDKRYLRLFPAQVQMQNKSRTSMNGNNNGLPHADEKVFDRLLDDVISEKKASSQILDPGVQKAVEDFQTDATKSKNAIKYVVKQVKDFIKKQKLNSKFVDIQELSKSVGLIEYLESQLSQAGNNVNTDTIQAKRNALKKIEKDFKNLLFTKAQEAKIEKGLGDQSDLDEYSINCKNLDFRTYQDLLKEYIQKVESMNKDLVNQYAPKDPQDPESVETGSNLKKTIESLRDLQDKKIEMLQSLLEAHQKSHNSGDEIEKMDNSELEGIIQEIENQHGNLAKKKIYLWWLEDYAKLAKGILKVTELSILNKKDRLKEWVKEIENFQQRYSDEDISDGKMNNMYNEAGAMVRAFQSVLQNANITEDEQNTIKNALKKSRMKKIQDEQNQQKLEEYKSLGYELGHYNVPDSKEGDPATGDPATMDAWLEGIIRHLDEVGSSEQKLSKEKYDDVVRNIQLIQKRHDYAQFQKQKGVLPIDLKIMDINDKLPKLNVIAT